MSEQVVFAIYRVVPYEVFFTEDPEVSQEGFRRSEHSLPCQVTARPSLPDGKVETVEDLYLAYYAGATILKSL